MTTGQLRHAIGFYADAEADGGDEDHCREHRVLYEQVLKERGDVVGDYVELPFGDRLAKLEVVS